MGWNPIKSATKAVNKAVKQATNVVKDTADKLNWNKWGQDLVVGGWTNGLGLGVKHHWYQDAIGSLTGVNAMKKAMNANTAAMESGYANIANQLQSAPTANASIAAGATGEQNAERAAEDSVQNAKKRRRSLQTTVNNGSMLGGGGAGRAKGVLG